MLGLLLHLLSSTTGSKRNADTSSNSVTSSLLGHGFWGTSSVVLVMATGTTAWWFYQRRRTKTNSDDTPPQPSEYGTTIPDVLLQSPYADELKLAVDLALEAGSNMYDYLHSKGTQYDSTNKLDVETKTGQSDFCTNIDIQNEKLIVDMIQQRYPHHTVIGEESVGTGSIPPIQPGTPTWIIDPIDGTTNFFAGLHALTCVSIGYCDGISGRPVVGVIYAPGTDELYIAVAGYGAYRNGERLYQRRDTSTKSLQDAVVCVEFGYTRDKVHIDTVLGSVSKVMESGCRAIRQLGSGCMDLCYVASGRLDVVYAGVANEGWKPWDYAAGLVLCQEAGCIMESLEQEVGTDFDLYSTSIICGVSRELVDELRLILFFH